MWHFEIYPLRWLFYAGMAAVSVLCGCADMCPCLPDGACAWDCHTTSAPPPWAMRTTPLDL